MLVRTNGFQFSMHLKMKYVFEVSTFVPRCFVVCFVPHYEIGTIFWKL